MAYLRANDYAWRRTTGCNDWFYRGAASAPSHWARVLILYYLPKYATVWKPLLIAPARQALKSALRMTGLLEWARQVIRRRPRQAS